MTDKAGRKGYHHGNLRQALIDAALSLIEERGNTGFTFAEIARKADVTPAAPYRHFKDREALLAEIARVGFIALAETLEDAWNRQQPSPLRAFDAVTAGYLDFAEREGAFFVVMFLSPVDRSDEALIEAVERAYAVLHRACAALAGGRAEAPPVSMMADHVWALCHGVARLFSEAGPVRPTQIPAQQMLEAATGIYLRGLGLIASE